MIRTILMIFFAFIGSWIANAQVEEQLAPTERKQRTVVTEPQTLYKGFFRSGLALNVSFIDKIFNVDGKKDHFPTNVWSNGGFTQIFFQYGFSDRLQAEVLIPYRLEQVYQSYLQESGVDSLFRWRNKRNGFSDLTLTAAYQLVLETPSHPSLTIYASATLPTGEKNPTNIKNPDEYDLPAGSGEASLDFRLKLRKVKYPFAYAFSANYTYFFGGNKLIEATDAAERPFRSGNNYALDGSFHFHLNDWIVLKNNAGYSFSGKDTEDGVLEEYPSWSVHLYPGLSFQIKQFRIDQAVLIPVIGSNASADPSYIFIVQYVF